MTPNCRSLVAALLGMTAVSSALGAQRRETPLSQVAVPHSYYWREMYIPQPTSGPSSFAWSPDGRDVIYSMQGSLWRQRLGTTIATQLTNGDTYDYQPDWSPDGRYVAYTAYDGRSLQLLVLDLRAGTTSALTADSAVNVEPRWSPDGTRIAFVSTSFNARWHIFVARFTNARLDSVTRITEDVDSKLPRYYYSKFDHYLSPTWSPDGRELIFVSNKSRVYGSGGLWRMEARAGAEPREIHYEETTWRARPDWSRDGRRVVFSSYHGRQWNQLAVMSSEHGNPMPLSYGDYDVTSPRWSPDFTRIGYITNEGGNTALEVLTVPGGKREALQIKARRYKTPMARIIVTVSDSETNRPLPSRVSVSSSTNGRFYAPDNAWRHSDEAIVRDEQHFEYGYWHSRGTDTLMVQPGQTVIEAWRGPQWHTVSRVVNTKPGQTSTVQIRLWPLANLRASGWWSGDMHVHMNYGGTYRNTPENLAHQARAEGLHVVENLIVNKEQRIPDIAYLAKGSSGLLQSRSDLLIANGQEFHTGLWGHSSLIGLKDHYLLPDYAGYGNSGFASLFPTNAAVFDLAHAQGALTGYVHPFDFTPDLSQVQGGVPYELPVDVALGKLDFLEVMGYSDHLITSDIWYKLLNCGFRIPAAAGTDAFPNFAELRGPPGLVRVFAKSGQKLEHRSWLDAVKAGRTFVTNAPILTMTLDDHEIGDAVRVPTRRAVHARVTLRSPVPIDHLEIVSNGHVVAQLETHAGGPGSVRVDTTVALPLSRTSWFVARAYNSRPLLPVLDLYAFASTSPIYVQLGNTRQRSPEDADYFIKWIDLLTERVKADTSWNGAKERDKTLETIARARAIFVSRR